METNEKSPQKRAAKVQIETENLQSSEKVDNFAKILYINPMTDFGFKKIFGDAEIMKAFLNDVIQPKSPIEKKCRMRLRKSSPTEWYSTLVAASHGRDTEAS